MPKSERKSNGAYQRKIIYDFISSEIGLLDKNKQKILKRLLLEYVRSETEILRKMAFIRKQKPVNIKEGKPIHRQNTTEYKPYFNADFLKK